jgi:hypothetical protein
MNVAVDNGLDTWIPRSAQEWFDWLVQAETKTVASYRDKPSLIISEYYTERETARDYEGREILELLQNANDQAAGLGLRGRVLIDLSTERLIVANTGLAFSVGGVASLQTSHFSPKRRRQAQLIGNKGLGFRSILNWSKTPIILSGSLSLAYCMNHLKSKLKELTDTSQEIARLIHGEQQNDGTVFLPLLPFPLYSANGDLAERLTENRARKTFDRCEELLLDGYDTVIGMPFDAPDASEKVSEQLDQIRAEILLFATNLGELRFHREGRNDVVWKRAGSEDVAEVLENGKPHGKWRICRMADKLPSSAVEKEQGEATDFEIVVAVPVDGSREPAPLFSHFPTNITLPLPIVCHATLEMEQNRKHFQQGRKCNEFILGRLAEFLADIAEQTAAASMDDPWAGCSLVMPLKEFPDDLERVNFPEQLLQAARSRKIVPTLGGTPVLASNARSVAGASKSWLAASIFNEVVPIRDDDDLQFLDELGVLAMEPAVIKKRIIAHPELTLDERVALTVGLVRHQIEQDACTPALLLDTSGNGLEDMMRVFITPSGGEVAELPTWVDIRFLNEVMYNKLKVALDIQENRQLQQELEDFGLLEYSLANVISTLVAAANRAIKAKPEQTETFENDLLRTVFRLYRAEGKIGRRPEYPEKSPLRLRNQCNESVAAGGLYFGRGFGTQGAIVQSLYEAWAPEKLIAEPRVLGLTDDMEALEGFLSWVGVAAWPREHTQESADEDYLKHVLRSIRYPASFQDKVVHSPSEMGRTSTEDVLTVDGLDHILEKADPIAVAAWLSLDDRIPAWARPAPTHARLMTRPPGARDRRRYDGSLPSYLRWKLETSAWLLSSGGARLRPKDCVLGERAAEALFPRPLMPSEADLERYGIRQTDVIEGWRQAGVLTSLASLERDEIYAKLLELPQRSPDGKLARPLYLWLLDASDIAIGEGGTNRKEFLARGKMWGRFGDKEDYFPVSQLHHADTEGLPEVLLQRLKIVDLRKRVGADKVERLFGVKPIDRAGIQQDVRVHQTAVKSTEANTNFQTAKPYLYKLRTSQTSQTSYLQTLKDIRLDVCSELRAAIVYEGERVEYDVPVWGWLIQDETLYVRADPADAIELSPHLLADAVGEALASVFRIGDGGEFALMLLCDDKDRQQLLRRMRGDSVVDDIESIKKEFAAFSANRQIVPGVSVIVPPTVINPALPGETPVPPDVPSGGPDAGKEQAASGGSLSVTEEEHTASHPNEQKLRIQRVSSIFREVIATRRVTDGDFCERKAMEFEGADDPKRFPLLVSQIVGSGGVGCDILSFSTAEEREAFRVGTGRDQASVARFIEVKGRSSATAVIELKGNELAAAERYGEKYYLYRLFEADDGGYKLAILQNPLGQKEALQPAVHVGMERAASTQQFTLAGGIQRNKES